jgi:DNA helicase-2/ATP-dependent DNA helicase PcrA
MSDLLARLNEPQQRAVTWPAQHALVLAGAGSGKTRVLTTRIAWLIATGQVGPAGILAVTFTNKAAREMSARLSAMLPVNTRSMWIGTFHGLCNRLLRAHHREAGLPPTFQILDSGDQLAAVKRLLKNLNVDEERFPPREIQHFINAHKEQGLRAAAAEAADDYTRRRIGFYAEYEAQCQREGVVDFAELLLRAYELLRRNEQVRLHYQRRFRHILVDEFQDTNRLQYAWLKLLAGHDGAPPAAGAAAAAPGAALFCVGDDDQSIYAFRGAEIGNMRDFEREFDIGEIIRLEQNYRSQGNILAAANAIILHNSRRLGKNLWTDQGEGAPIRVFEGLSDLDEARYVVEEVRALVRDGMHRSHIALLYRSNAQSRVLEHQLFAAGVPYRVYGGLRFFERQEVKHALAYLRLLVNPDDDTAFLRVVNFPARGIGARSLEALVTAAQQTQSSLYNATCSGVAALAGRAMNALAAFVVLIETMRRDTAGLPLPELIDHVVEKSGLRSHYLGEKEGQDRLENLDELVNAGANFLGEADALLAQAAEDAAAGGAADPGADPAAAPLPADAGRAPEVADVALSAFLTHAALEAGEHQAAEGDDALQLMTVHSAKGLEFDAVFICGLEQGLFPHENALLDADGLEEERRLMYVAITRARQRLYLAYAQTRMLHGQTRYAMPSAFLAELPQDLLRRVNRLPPAASFADRRVLGGQPAVAAAREEPEIAEGLRIGQNVRHNKFGVGVIIAAEGRGPDARVQVNFGTSGVKWLALGYARLVPL